MTFSILAYDEKSGTYGGAATTGSLCVGGWVLRGDSESGMSASQGTSPSTLWGTRVLREMGSGATAQAAVDAVVSDDPGRNHRQLAALDRSGTIGAFTGTDSVAVCGHVADRHVVVCGNLLSSRSVLSSTLDGFCSASGSFAERLLTGLRAGKTAGGDSRGLLSAALLIVGPDMAPLSLRVDYSVNPLQALDELYKHSQTAPYVDWLDAVPTTRNPHKTWTE